MNEPRYSKKEQRERMAQFERWVKRARKDWRRGVATVIMSYGDYLKMSAAAERWRRLQCDR